MSTTDWIGIGVIAIAIGGALVLLNQITKPYNVKTEEEFEKHHKEIKEHLERLLKEERDNLDPSQIKHLEQRLKLYNE